MFSKPRLRNLQSVIPLSKLDYTDRERASLLQTFETDTKLFGPKTQEVVKQIQAITGAQFVIPTHSCTVALELALAGLGIGSGDEVIVPANTFMATATAVVAVGATPVIVDIDEVTLTLDIACARLAITEKTRAIIPVHYGGMLADMESIRALAKEHYLFVVEDAAHIFGGKFADGQPLLGSNAIDVSDAMCFSFDQTKHIAVPGKAGCLITNDQALAKQAELRACWGNDFLAYKRGEVSWYDGKIPHGTSALMQEMHAAVLSVQLARIDEILQKRQAVWDALYEGLKRHEEAGRLTLPSISKNWHHPAHLLYVLVNESNREALIEHAKQQGVVLLPHYKPLNMQAAWPHARFVSCNNSNIEPSVAEITEKKLLRVPCYHMSSEEVARVINVFTTFAW